MSRPVFVDTSGWYALVDADDAHHKEARGSINRILSERRTLVTTNHVVSESYTLLRARLGCRPARKLLSSVRSSANTRRVFVLESWEDAAESLLMQYEDQDLSYVDATSFVAMRSLGLQEALAFDHHFLVLGFTLIANT